MKIIRTLQSTTVFGLVITLLVSSVPLTASAAFMPNRVMDDQIFENYNSMTAADIDNMLNARNSCISPQSGFSAIDPIGYNPTNGYLYGGNVSAGTVIYHAAQAYELNPQVLITTLQKEQSLITSTSCSTNTISKAVGYACPDSGGSYSYTDVNLYSRNGTTYTAVSGICVNSAAKAGFTQQIIRAAWLLRYSQQRSKGNINWAIIKGNWNNSDDLNATYSGFMTQGCFKRSKYEANCTNYDGYATIDGQSVHLDTGASASLYRYTPHFSGNRNFVTLFNSYFGSTVTGQCLTNRTAVATSIGFNNRRGVPANANFIIPSGSGSGCVEFHEWQSGYTDWKSHVSSNLPSVDPTSSYVTFGDTNGDGKDEAVLVNHANTGSGMIEFHVWSPGMQTWQSHIASNFPTSSYAAADASIAFADLTGRGYDQAVLNLFRNTGSGMIEAHVWNTWMQSWQKHTATNLGSVDPASFAIHYADVVGGGYDQAVLVAVRSTGSGRIEFHTWNPGMQSWKSHVASNQGTIQ